MGEPEYQSVAHEPLGVVVVVEPTDLVEGFVDVARVHEELEIGRGDHPVLDQLGLHEVEPTVPVPGPGGFDQSFELDTDETDADDPMMTTLAVPAGVYTIVETPAEDLPLGRTQFATKKELVSFFEHLEAELDACEFYPPHEMRPKMARNMRNMFQRIRLTQQDVQTLFGIIKALSKGPAAGRKSADEQDGDSV